MTDELLAGAVTALRNAIPPLIYQTPIWDGQPRWQHSLYTRMRQALTTTTTQSGAPMQASKAPARIDVLAWFCDIDTSVATWTDGTTTPNRLHQLHHQTWTPQHLDLVKAITRRCETWTHTARELLGDNPTVVPLRLPCPKCAQLWHHPPSNEAGRVYALRVSENGAQCLACKTKWVSDAEINVFIRMLAC